MCDENLDRPHSLWDQHFGTSIDPDDVLSDLDSISTDLIMYRPIVRNKRRYHPFWKSVVRKGRGASTVHANKNKLEVTLDVSQLAPEEINVKVVDKNVIVEAKHDEKEDEYGWVSRQFVRKYIVPSQCDISRVESRLSSDDILTISAARKEPLNTEVCIMFWIPPPTTSSAPINTRVADAQQQSTESKRPRNIEVKSVKSKYQNHKY
ncbi:PREDICTED: protein lethal(2)essential for life-like [Dufourea novaeangliae]|uniref:protein lethal(2)essential for life-like n=1 Tax=Dufourea novaeangliae TaxID=178035 RepID=UPI000767D042|nr:PREDICTED: protein lethal(2)essential for life-like [Dufourea novaeangliae]